MLNILHFDWLQQAQRRQFVILHSKIYFATGSGHSGKLKRQPFKRRGQAWIMGISRNFFDEKMGISNIKHTEVKPAPGTSDPFAYRVARQARVLCNLMQRHVGAKKYPSNIAYHFHSDKHLSPALKLGWGSRALGAILARYIPIVGILFGCCQCIKIIAGQ
ncbi:MAG: hypothetical protein R8K20_02360 [Gallionellaceae bacterium]